ncbi:hypothetical protein ACFQVA_37370 [Actinomadura keratinilytica]
MPGAVCQRMERLLAADGALPAGRAAYAVSIAARPPTRTPNGSSTSP